MQQDNDDQNKLAGKKMSDVLGAVDTSVKLTLLT